MSREPNLLIIGAMKSGTSSLHNYLATHPDIFMSSNKEPMHFSREENWLQGNDNYLRLFESATNERYVGESSTEYSKLPFREGVAKRLHDFSPEARLIYIMRDPFERTVSQFKHMVKTGRTASALTEEIRKPNDYLTNSYYAYQLRPYIELFGRDAIFIGLFEDLVAYPETFCQNVFRWLGIDESFVPSNFKEVFNASPHVLTVRKGMDFKGNMVKKISQIQLINNLTPEVIRRFLKRTLTNTIEFDFSSEEFQCEVAKARELLDPILIGWVEELEELTGLTIKQWSIKQTSNVYPCKSNISREIIETVEKVIGEKLTRNCT